MERYRIGSSFEFVTVAGLRARQLLQGCTPRIEPAPGSRAVKTAEQEVASGLVGKIDQPPAGAPES